MAGDKVGASVHLTNDEARKTGYFGSGSSGNGLATIHDKSGQEVLRLDSAVQKVGVATGSGWRSWPE